MFDLLKDSIAFTFVQATRDGHFKRETEWGFAIAGTDDDTSKARWGQVEHVGPDVKYVKPGDFILIESTKWTTSVEVDAKKFWRTLEPFVMLVSEERPADVL